MKYFDTLPKIITTDPNGNYILAVNLLARAGFITNILNNPSLYYTYDIQENDTPEIIANKYYGDSYRYWIVLLANSITDPQWSWPLNNKQFNAYLIDKYTAAAAANNQTALTYIQSTPYLYRLIRTSVDSTTSNTTVNNYSTDSKTYANTVTFTKTVNLPSGASTTVSLSKQILSIYDWENEQNESKRTIRIVNSTYATQIEQQLKSLMGT
jgi:hypothetical protein